MAQTHFRVKTSRDFQRLQCPRRDSNPIRGEKNLKQDKSFPTIVHDVLSSQTLEQIER